MIVETTPHFLNGETHYVCTLRWEDSNQLQAMILGKGSDPHAAQRAAYAILDTIRSSQHSRTPSNRDYEAGAYHRTDMNSTAGGKVRVATSSDKTVLQLGLSSPDHP